MRNLDWHCRYLDPQQAQFSSITFVEGINEASYHLTQERHHSKVVLDEAELGIQAHILVDVTCGIVRLGTKNRAYLKDALKDSHHNLLVELRTLCQERWSSEVVKLEDVRATLGRCSNDLWR